MPSLSSEEATDLIRKWYASGLRAVNPKMAVERDCTWNGSTLVVDGWSAAIGPSATLVAIAFGKAATEMARGLTAVAGERVSRGIILTKDDHADTPPSGWTVFEASHPVPDDRGIAATRAILAAVSSLGPDDVVVVLVSGGGSALLESPREQLTLADIQEVTRLLLKAGAPIQHLNAVRSELSEVKGGGLRRAIGSARCVSIILSDVLGNDPTIIASGPTIARAPDPTTALSLLDHYGVLDRVPDSVIALLKAEPVALDSPVTDGDAFVIVGDNDIFIDEVARSAAADGYGVDVTLRLVEGEAREVARRFLGSARTVKAGTQVVIGGGEATVTVTGDGIGGRNTEFALEAATALLAHDLGWVVASLASDGQDGSVDAAGAIVGPHTIESGNGLGLDAGIYLDNNDSGGYLDRVGALVKPGPTGTNVNDLYIAVRVDTRQVH